MSDRTPPPRRRIAGEAPTPPVAKKAAPAKKPAAKKPAAKKPAAKKTAAKKAVPATASTTARKAPAAKKAAIQKKAPARKAAPATSTPVTAAVAASPETAAPQVARPALKPRSDRVAGDEGAPAMSRLAVAVAAIVLIAGAVVGTFGFVHWRSDDFSASRTSAVSAASSAAETIFSFRYDKLDQHTTEAKALMTPKYGKEFDKIVPTLTDIAPQRKVTVEAVSRKAAALPCGNECSATKASVLIFVDQDRRLAADDTSTVFGNRIVVEMVKTGGDWLVNDVRAL